jgi:hypothetical protein
VRGENEGDRSEREIASIIDVAQRVDSSGSNNQPGDKISFR